MHLVAQHVLDPAGQVRGHAAELGVAERILAAAGIGDEAAVRAADALAGDHHAVADALDHRLHAGEEIGFVVDAFGEQDEVRRIVPAYARKPGGGGQPAGVAAHRLVDEHLGRGLGHRRHVQRAFAHRDRGVLRRRAEARAAVGDREVVVDGLGHADAGQRIAEFGGQLRDLERGVGRIVAAVVEEPAHVVGLEHGQQAFVLRPVGLQRLQL